MNIFVPLPVNMTQSVALAQLLSLFDYIKIIC
jgi:hypothetical protein